MSFLTDYDPEKAEAKKRQNDQIFKEGAYLINNDMRDLMSGYNLGADVGRREFYQDPTMVEIENIRRRGLEGYDAGALGALRATARGELAGQQSQYLQKLRSMQARQGVSGSRAIASIGAAQQANNKNTATAENKMMLDQAAEVRKGEDKYADFRMRQKYGQMSTGAGFAQASSAQNAAQKQKDAAFSNSGNSYICTEIHKHEKFTLGQLKELMKMRKYVAEVNSKMIDIYDVEGPKLVAALNEKNITWTNFKPIVEQIITEWKSDKYLGAFLYVQFVKDLGVLAHAE